MAVPNVNSAISALTCVGRVAGTTGMVVSVAHVADKILTRLAESNYAFEGKYIESTDAKGEKVKKWQRDATRNGFGKAVKWTRDHTSYIRPKTAMGGWTSAGTIVTSLAALQLARYAGGKSTVVSWARNTFTQIAGKVGR